MSLKQTIIHGGRLVTPQGEIAADLMLAEGLIVAIGPHLDAPDSDRIDATGLHIFPGLIDSHVHFNDPGRADWEGIATGSRALAAGGGTVFFDMPLNSSPPTLNAAAFEAKLAVASRDSITDFALWGGLVPGALEHLEPLAERGVIGFKAFMSNSGMADFPTADPGTLREGMKRAAQLGMLVAVHAESETLTARLTARARQMNQTSARAYLDSRPIQAELEAIALALELAGETGCALHIVHVSSAAGVALVTAARARGVAVTCETCPHYLTLTETDLEQLGARAKCAPPLRPGPERDALWQCVAAGEVHTIGSDHSPAPPEMKQDANFFKIWGGIPGVQLTLPLLLAEHPTHGKLPLRVIAGLTSANVATRFGLPPGKGRLTVGADADLAFLDLRAGFTVRPEDLHDRHRLSPYSGRRLTGRVVRTILRGRTIFQNGTFSGPPRGRFITPVRRQRAT